MIYLDSAAVVKLVRSEPASAALVDWLDERSGAPLIASAVVEVEVPRALQRSAPEALPLVPATLALLYRLEIDPIVRAMAAAYAEPGLRSLDAIHLATAQLVAGDSDDAFEAFVTYDKKLLAAAAGIGLPTESPGA